MRPELVHELRDEVAEISIESLAELLARGQASGSEPSVEFYGVLLKTRQAEQLTLWLVDQQSTAAALGMKVPAWRGLLERTLVELLSPVAAPHQVKRMRDEEAEYWRKQMRKILGEGLAGPQKVPDEPTAPGGIMSLLNARRSGKPGTKRHSEG
ncbi:MAG: hypothetical protein AAB426_15305 [Myxococcota bacterium]